MAHRDRKLADERFPSRLKARAFDGGAADRIGPIANEDLHAVPRGGAQAVGHRIDIGVDARADVLQVDDERLDAAQHVGGRLPRLAVQGIDRHASPRVVAVRRFHHVVLHVGAETVLRAENRRKCDAFRGHGPVDDMDEAAIDRRMVTDDADSGTYQTIGGEENVGTEADGGGHPLKK